MSAENPADVIEQAAKAIHGSQCNCGTWEPDDLRAARALHDAGLLADPADRDGQRNLQWNVLVARVERAEAEVAELRHRLACLLCELTGNRMSKTNYDVRTMVQEVEAYFERTVDDEVTELRATVERVRAMHNKIRSDYDFDSPRWCAECAEDYPCATIRALDGGEQP